MSRSPLVDRWASAYTRGLPVEVAAARRAELANDVHEHVATGGRRAAVVGRMLRGVPADVLWHFDERRAMSTNAASATGRPTGLRAAWATLIQAWFTPVAALVGAFDVLLAIGIARDPLGTMPGRALGPAVLLLLAAGLFAGLYLRWASAFGAEGTSRLSGSPARGAAIALATVAVAYAVVGFAGFAAGGIALVAGLGFTILATRSRRDPPTESSRSNVLLADVFIIVGTLPALAFFWFIVPPLLALLVIAGVLGTGPGTRRRAAVS